jgi:hypothetical protein
MRHFILAEGKSGQLDRNTFEVVQLELSKRDGRKRAEFMKRVHKPAMKRSPARRLGARLRPRLRMHTWQRLGNDGTEASRPCKPNDGDNQMKEKGDDLAHPGMAPKPRKAPNFAPSQ